MIETRFTERCLSEIRAILPAPDDEGNISVTIEDRNFRELLNGYDKHLEYRKALISLERYFQEKINEGESARAQAGDISQKALFSTAIAKLRREKDFITSILGA